MDFADIVTLNSINKVRLTELNIPLSESMALHSGETFTTLHPIIVELWDSDGNRGLGCIDFWDHPRNPFLTDLSGNYLWNCLKNNIQPFFMNAFKMNKKKPEFTTYLDIIHDVCKAYPQIQSGFELALWDLTSRKNYAPPQELFWRAFFDLGHASFESDDIDEMYRRMNAPHPVKMLLQPESYRNLYEAQIERALKDKIKSFSFPLGLNIKQQLPQIMDIRDRFPDITLDIDANGLFRPGENVEWKELLEFYHNLEKEKIRLYEQPLDYRVGWYAINKFRETIKTPLSFDQSILTIQDLQILKDMVIKDNWSGSVNLKSTQLGGLWNTLKILVDLDLHNQLYPENRLRVIPGFQYEQDLMMYASGALFTLPVEQYEFELPSNYLYNRDSIFIPEFKIKEGDIFGSDAGGIGTLLIQEKLQKHTNRTIEFNL